MYSSSWPNWPSESPKRPRSPSSFPTSSDSSAFSSPTPSFSLGRDRFKKVAIDGKEGSEGASLIRLVIPRVRFAWWRRPRQGEDGQFSLRELKVATDNFSDNNIIDRCSFGFTYKGKLADGSLVAVKRAKSYLPFYQIDLQILELQFQSEIRMTDFPAHKNLLRLCGFCKTTTEKLLVYPYMANGSLASCLRERVPTKPPLDWPTRRRIALGCAKGLSYLHDHCKIIHRDVKAANIFLDEEYEAVVGGFGIAIFMDYEDTHVTTDICGTIGYIAPEYLSRGECSEKIDVFGYGIMLLELITGQRTYDLARLANDDDVMLLTWVKRHLEEKMLVVDPDLKTNYIEFEVECMIQVALLCTQVSPVDRPKMSEVVRMLVFYAEIAEKWEHDRKNSWEQCENSSRDMQLATYDNSDNLTSIELSIPNTTTKYRICNSVSATAVKWLLIILFTSASVLYATDL